MKILVIDDNHEITDLFYEYLRAKGHDCTVANDGVSGLDAIEHGAFDAVMLDIAMPEFTGFDVINALEKTGKIKSQNIIVLTASDIVKEDDIVRMKKQGIKSFLKKPIKLDLLLNEMSRFANYKNNVVIMKS